MHRQIMQQSVMSCKGQSGIKGETGREKEGIQEKTYKLKNVHLINTGKKRGTLESVPIQFPLPPYSPTCSGLFW